MHVKNSVVHVRVSQVDYRNTKITQDDLKYQSLQNFEV